MTTIPDRRSSPVKGKAVAPSQVTTLSIGGTVTATAFVGDGSLLTNLPSSGGSSSQWVTTDVGIHTLSNIGIGTINPTTRISIGGTTGISFANNNVRIGDVFTGSSITSGYNNNFIGAGAGRSTTTGVYNNFFGRSAGRSNTTGCNNNFFGRYAGCCNSTGCNNIAIGRNSGTTGLTPSGLINLTTGSNCIIMGNADHTTACIQIAWGVASDIRYKHVFGCVPHGRDFLRGINPIKYSFKNEQTGEIKDDRIRYGFSAQEILELESNEGVIVNTSNPNHLGITHDYLLPVLVNAIKELDLENEYLKKEILNIKESISRVGICSG